MINKTLKLAFGVLVLLLNLPAFSQSSDLNKSGRYTIESGVYKVLQMPSKHRQGRLQVFESNEQLLSGCKSCGARFYFDNDLKIRVAHEGSMFTAQDLAVFPTQNAYFVVDDGKLVTVGFSELELDIPAEAKLRSLKN